MGGWRQDGAAQGDRLDRHDPQGGRSGPCDLPAEGERFPPHGLDVQDNFFSLQRKPSETLPGRRYIGICAPGDG